MSGMAACEPKLRTISAAGERAGATVVQRDLDGLWADEASAPHDELRAALLVGLEVNRDLALDHVLLAAENLAHVRPDLANQGAEFCGVSDDMGDTRAPQLVLGGHAGDRRTRAADPAALDDGDLLAGPGEVPR